MEFYRITERNFHKGWEEKKEIKNYITLEQAERNFEKELQCYQANSKYKIENIKPLTSFAVFYDNKTRWKFIEISKEILKFEIE